MVKKRVIIPIFVPHKGCHFDCIYCNQKKISGQIEELTKNDVREIIEKNLETISSDTYVEIGFYGGSFTGISKEQQIDFLSTANDYVRSGAVDAIRLSTRPDYINDDILTYLKRLNVGTIELGVQSMDDNVLKMNNRGHNVNDVYKAAKIITDYGFCLGIQTMVGLYGSNGELDIDTAVKVTKIAPSFVRIYPTLVIRETYLEKLFNEKLYTPLSIDETIKICKKIIKIYYEKNISVIRLGLTPTENISLDKDVVSGPFHPSIRQMIEAERLRELIVDEIERYKIKDKSELIIWTQKGNISSVIGQRRCNIDFLTKKFNIKRIVVKESEFLKSEVSLGLFRN
jgi:histone acetyltransferase (RNA polymerase elongator complex component)